MSRRPMTAMMVVLSMLVTGLVYAPDALAGKREKTKKILSGAKVVMIIASRNFRDEEFARPEQILSKDGAKVVVASSSNDRAVGMLRKVKVTPDMLVSDINVSEFDAIIFVGGSGAKEYYDDETAHDICRSAVAQDKILAAICIAPVTLAKAGVLKKVKCTAWSSCKRQIKAYGGKWTGADVEVDGDIITGNGPKAARDFGNAIRSALRKQRKSSSRKKDDAEEE